jgi:predicted nucleotidyltransferase
VGEKAELHAFLTSALGGCKWSASSHSCFTPVDTVHFGEAGNNQYQILWKIDKHTIADFGTKLSYESWDTVFDSINTDCKFNCFLNTYFGIFYSGFPLIRVKNELKIKLG